MLHDTPTKNAWPYLILESSMRHANHFPQETLLNILFACSYFGKRRRGRSGQLATVIMFKIFFSWEGMKWSSCWKRKKN